jgi:hypothetical protein
MGARLATTALYTSADLMIGAFTGRPASSHRCPEGLRNRRTPIAVESVLFNVMKRALGALALAVTAAATTGGRTDAGQHRALKLEDSSSSNVVLGFRHTRQTSWLVRVDARTLRTEGGRRLNVGAHGSAWSFSPDRSLVALGRFEQSILLVRTEPLKLLARIETGVDGSVVAHTWVGSRLLVVLQRSAPVETSVVSIDSASRRVDSRVDLPGSVEGVARARQALVLLLGPPANVGPTRLVRVDGTGGARLVELPRISSGREGRTRHVRPGLAVDQGATRAFVVGEAAPVAEIDLRTLAVQYHDLSHGTSSFGRLHGWLEPAAGAKAPPSGPTRSAAWLGDGKLLVSGFDIDVQTKAGKLELGARPAGLRVIDTRAWTAQTIDRTASSFAVANRRLLAWSWLWDPPRSVVVGHGLRGYERAGVRRFHLFDSQPIVGVQVFGDRAIVARGSGGTIRSLINVTKGRIVRPLGTSPHLLVGNELSEWSGGATPASVGT